MRNVFYAVGAFLFIFSCDPSDKSHQYVTYRTLPEGAGIEHEKRDIYDNRPATPIQGTYPGLDSLVWLRLRFFEQNEQFDLEKFQLYWEKFRQEVRNREISKEEAIAWFNLTGFLFQVTGDAMVAEELERTVYTYFFSIPGSQPDSLVLPYVFTRNTDFMHLNLYLPTSIHFQHSLGGNVTVNLETEFPESGTARVLFEMETKQYMELYVRIPSWAEDASVTVKGVKYLAPAGSYSKVAKKWKDGDVVEIEFPLENLPPYMKPGS